MKKVFGLSALALTSVLLVGCASKGNPCAGKSFAWSSITTTFDGCTEEDFFNAAANVFYGDKQAFETAIKNKLLSASEEMQTANGKLNIGNVKLTNDTLYNGKKVTVYQVNLEHKSEYVVESLCHFGADPETKDLYHFYDHGKLQEDGSLIVEMFKILKPYTISSTFGEYKNYQLTTMDSGIMFADDILTVNLSTKLVSYAQDGTTVLAEFKCNSAATFSL